MKKSVLILALLIGASLAAAAAVAPRPEAVADKVTVPLSKPGQPARIEVNLLFGSIKVTGYNGNDVLVEANPREKSLTETGPDRGLRFARPLVMLGYNFGEDEKGKEKEQKAKSAGMKQIPLESSGLTVEEQDNVVSVEVDSFRRGYDLDIKVPAGSSLKLSGASLESILVENISGEIESEANSGTIKLLNVSGPVTVNCNYGNIEAVLNRLAPDKPMSFVTLNGDVDVTLPADTKANLRIKSNSGDLFSDFDVVLRAAPAEPEKASTRDGAKFRVTLERSVVGTINGGGPELKFQNWNGNIYIRKKK